MRCERPPERHWTTTSQSRGISAKTLRILILRDERAANGCNLNLVGLANVEDETSSPASRRCFNSCTLI